MRAHVSRETPRRMYSELLGQPLRARGSRGSCNRRAKLGRLRFIHCVAGFAYFGSIRVREARNHAIKHGIGDIGYDEIRHSDLCERKGAQSTLRQQWKRTGYKTAPKQL